nr:hypothetical protein [Tanacetum cinerariifolium]
MRLLGMLIWLGRTLSLNILSVRLRRPSYPHTVVSPNALPDSTPPTCHVEESEGSDMFGARSMLSDSTAPLSPDHPLTHTTPTLVPILYRSAHMVVRVPPVMLPGLSTSMVEVAAMSNLAFCKRFRSSYESSPSSSPPDILLRKRYRGTSELVEDDMDVEDDEEEDDKEEDEEMEESLDFAIYYTIGQVWKLFYKNSSQSVVKVNAVNEVVVSYENNNADRAQSSRVPVPLPKDPYEAIRQAYLVGTDTKSEPFEGKTEAPKSARMAVRVPLMMLPGLSTSMAEVAAMFDLAFCKRFRSSYKSSPSLLPPDIPSRKRYQGMSELVEDDIDVEDDEEGDDKEEDEEMKESLDFDSVNEGAENKGPAVEDDPAVGDEVLVVGDEDLGMGVEGLSLGGDEAIPGVQQRESPVAETIVGHSSGSVLESETQEIVSALRKPTQTTWMDPDDDIVNIDVHAYLPLAPPVQTSPSPMWSSSSLLISPAPSIVHSPISSPIISLTVLLPVASPATAETEGFLTEVGARVETRGD